MDHIVNILDYITESFIHAWPYLLVTLPISVAVKMSGVSNNLNKVLTARPVIAIFLSTFVGAFSPLCSCTVIPVIASLLIGGIPLAPVMSFWLASPSMDPEIFFLTVSSLGWELAVWRLSAALVLSLGGGLLTFAISNRGWLGNNPIRHPGAMQTAPTLKILVKDTINHLLIMLNKGLDFFRKKDVITVSGIDPQDNKNIAELVKSESSDCCSVESSGNCCSTQSEQSVVGFKDKHFWQQLLSEIKNATLMVAKFMLLAWFLGAIIRLYVPGSWITNTLGNNNPYSIIIAAGLGIPAYTNNLAAMPLVGELLAHGMHPSTALAFLIAGPTTTLPAMSAVWGLVERKVFYLYVGFSLFGAILLGYFYKLFSAAF